MERVQRVGAWATGRVYLSAATEAALSSQKIILAPDCQPSDFKKSFAAHEHYNLLHLPPSLTNSLLPPHLPHSASFADTPTTFASKRIYKTFGSLALLSITSLLQLCDRVFALGWSSYLPWASHQIQDPTGRASVGCRIFRPSLAALGSCGNTSSLVAQRPVGIRRGYFILRPWALQILNLRASSRHHLV
jgi:hypothetical protein